MVRLIEGELDAAGLRIAIVASRFNDEIVSGLLDGALHCLKRHGAPEESLVVYRVPGAFELPAMVARLTRRGEYDAVVALGALIRGETPHFDFISHQVTSDLSRIAIDSSTPIAFGVITCDNHEQARHRSSGTANKGWESALAAIEMATLFRAAEDRS
jgi:6,7-dimethyl-8-ribityllumazine synthase